jgi:hypothetical protein
VPPPTMQAGRQLLLMHVHRQRGLCAVQSLLHQADRLRARIATKVVSTAQYNQQCK